MKKQRKIEKDNRGVAIYARKSRITNKGDSIGVQFKQCADYAKKELGLDEEYEFLQYEDKGLSGYFSDRPDFQRMLHDVQDGKIKAIVCYKLDRVGRKTADLIRLMDFLEMYHVNLLICSNGINTASGLYKIFIQIFAVIAEFERDTLTERIVDNMMELAKDGRWLGGNTPMGFTVRRVTTGSGKGKSAYSYLESLPEEKRMVQRLYEIFRTTRSIQSTAKQMNEEGFHTPSGAAFNASTTRLVLRNPIYCTADKRSYDYFIDHDGNVFGDMIEFDGTHGLSAYNKTDQEKYEGSDSTFISPKYVQTIESKPVSEWIIAVGRHEGFIPSEQWIEVQELLDAIAEKYNRPHRKTNALLAGLVHCPYCGRRLSVISESDRWTNGKPRFKYVCPGYRKKECNFKAADGVLLDEFVVQQLSELSDENSERFRSILEIKIEEVLEQSQTVQEHNLIKKKRDKLKADIAAQTRNLREADGSIKQFIQEDLQNLAEELRETKRQISKLDEGRKNNMIAIRDLEMTKERLLSFAEYAKDAQPEVLVTLIQTIVERIYIVDKDDERFCHIFIKGCTDEDYTGFFRTAGYIEQKTTPVCDSEQCCIANVLETDANTVFYGLPADERKQNALKTIVRVSITAVCTVAFAMVLQAAQTVMYETYHARSVEVLIALLCPPIIIFAGWCVMQLISHFVKVEPILTRKSRIARAAIIFLLLASYVIVIPCEMWLLAAEGGNQAIPLSQNTIFYWMYRAILTADVSFPWIYAPIGAALWIFRAPSKRQNAESGGESCRA